MSQKINTLKSSDFKNCYYRGNECEDRFENMLIILKFQYFRFSNQDPLNANSHLDFLTIINDQTMTIDVKSIKHYNMKNSHNLPQTINPPCWVEILNVHGSRGWAYSDCSHVAFETPSKNDFYIVNSEDLRYLVRDFMSSNTSVVKKGKANKSEKVPYSRDGRSDVIIKIDFERVLTLSGFYLSATTPPHPFV